MKKTPVEEEKKQVEEEEEDIVNKLLKFEVLTGGKGGSGNDWLKDMKTGTYFLACQKNNQNPVLGEFVLLQKGRQAVCLRVSRADEVWFDRIKFCTQHELIEILVEGTE